MADFDPCLRCDSPESVCCDVDGVTGVCNGRCDANGVHPEDWIPGAHAPVMVDASVVAKWLHAQDGSRCGGLTSSRQWFEVREADKLGLGSIIDELRRLERGRL